MREKRKFLRFGISLKVSYVIQKEPRVEKAGATKNISVGGMQLVTKEKLDIGNKLGITISVPEALNPVHLNGMVLWSKEFSENKEISYVSGIEFGKIEEDNKNTFLRFLCGLMEGRVEK